MILRVSSIGVAGLLSLLMLTAVVPPIVADQSDRAVINAPVTLLTAPVDGEIMSVSAMPGREVKPGDSVAEISNARLDRGTLISLEQKASDAREKLEATKEKRNSDLEYIKLLDSEIADQADQLKTQLQSQIVEMRARVAESDALSGEKKALVDRQTNMVARDAASLDMLKPTSQQYSAALHKADAEKAKLSQKLAQLDALEKGIYVGDDLVNIDTIVQKRRDIDLDAKRMAIEEKELTAVLSDHQRLIETERRRLKMLAAASVQAPTQGKILTVGVAPGRHVNAGDAISSVVDCDAQFVVAIFSYRQGQSMKVGTRVRVDGSSFGSGVVSEILPKTSDKFDERFAVPFPQTERRELYAIIQPSDRPGSNSSNAALQPDRSTACAVGRWVTVTRENGIVPSMSVTWRRLETAVDSWRGNHVPQQDRQDLNRQAGIARLAARFRSTAVSSQRPDLDDWSPHVDSVVSR